MTNYDIIREKSRRRFLEYNQEAMIRRLHLVSDSDYLYLDFCGKPYCIHRTTGVVEGIDGGESVLADFNESMSIFDFLCGEKERATLSGTWVSVGKLANYVPSNLSSRKNNNFFAEYEQLFHCNTQKLASLFAALGYQRFHPGDVSCIFPVFPDFSAVFQFWRGDDDFPPGIHFLWDANTLNFIHYETIFYIQLHWLEKMTKMLKQKEGIS